MNASPPRRGDFEPVPAHSLNPFATERTAVTRVGAIANAEQQRAIAEIQARLIIARSNPRDPIRCMDAILADCTRPSLAQTALYQYGRGGTSVSGPSIRLAETMARRWGNIASGIKEVSRVDGYSECIAYAWDLETGFYDERQFQVRHWRDTKKGGHQLTDERDIYELIANMGQRRKRAVLLTVLPGDVVEAAVEQCERTLKADADTSPEALRRVVTAFAEFGVTQAQIEKRCQCRLEAIRPAQLVQLRKIFASLKDEMSTPKDWFEDTPWTQMEAQRQASAQPAQVQPTEDPPAKQEQQTSNPAETGQQSAGFEGWVLDENGESEQEDPTTDPVEYARAFERMWQNSANREALIENNRDGLGWAAECSIDAKKIVDSVLVADEPPASHDVMTVIPLPEGRTSLNSYVDAVRAALAVLPADKLHEWSELQAANIERAPQPIRLKVARAIMDRTRDLKVDMVPQVAQKALDNGRSRAAEQSAAEAPTTAETGARSAPTEQGEDPDAKAKAEAFQRASEFVTDIEQRIRLAGSGSTPANNYEPLLNCLNNQALQAGVKRTKGNKDYSKLHTRILNACAEQPAFFEISQELQVHYPDFVDDVNNRKLANDAGC